MSCPFCAIVSGEADAEIIDESEETMTFAPLEPVSEGHVLVIPKDHYGTLFDLPEPTLRAVTERAKAIAERLRDGGFDGVNLLHASGEAAQQSVPHFHFHLAPRRHGDGLDLWPESGYEPDNSDRTYDAVHAAMEGEES